MQGAHRGEILGQDEKQGLPGEAVLGQRGLEGIQQQAGLTENHHQQPRQNPPISRILPGHLLLDVQVDGREEQGGGYEEQTPCGATRRAGWCSI
jgi:hypothetical protein